MLNLKCLQPDQNKTAVIYRFNMLNLTYLHPYINKTLVIVID